MKQPFLIVEWEEGIIAVHSNLVEIIVTGDDHYSGHLELEEIRKLRDALNRMELPEDVTT